MNNFNINHRATSFKLWLNTLVSFVVISFFIDAEYDGGSCLKNIDLEYKEHPLEFKTNHILFIELEINNSSTSSVNQNYNDKHYSKTKRLKNIITEFKPYITIENSYSLITNPKVGLFILYSSLKLPS